jgi:nucleotide-binding universal stress UspA family protein
MIYENVLVPLKGSEPLEKILPHIEAIAQSGLAKKITFLRIAGIGCPQDVLVSPTNNSIVFDARFRKEAISRNISEAKEYLANLVSAVKINRTDICWEVLPPTFIVESIVQYVTENGVDLLVMATRARAGIRRWIFGNKAEKVLQSVNIPVLMIRIPESGP